jgi:hypothetical protein
VRLLTFFFFGNLIDLALPNVGDRAQNGRNSPEVGPTAPPALQMDVEPPPALNARSIAQHRRRERERAAREQGAGPREDDDGQVLNLAGANVDAAPPGQSQK